MKGAGHGPHPWHGPPMGHGSFGRRHFHGPTSWWRWWRGYYSPYGWYGWPPYTPTYRACCVDVDNGVLFCSGASYPARVLRVSGGFAEIATRSGVSWYRVCEV
jgi:hypothetical protein